MLSYRRGPESDPFHSIYSSRGWLTDYDPPGDFPFWVNVEPTSRCQLDCLFCSRRLSRRPLGDMDMGMAKEIFAEAARHPGAAVRFTGWGEPLLHPRIGELAEDAKKRGIRLKIYTNSLALTPRLFDRFMDIGVDDLQFSLQGLDGEQYEFNRRGASWNETESRILMASERRGARERPFLSVLTSVLATELEGRDPEAFCGKWLRHVDKVAIDLTNLNFVAETEAVTPYLDRQSAGLARGRCVDVFLALEVKYDGAMQFCGQDSQGLECHTVGRFGEMGLAEAWRHPRLEAQRDLVGRALGHDSSPVCRNCYHNTDKYDLFKKALESCGPDGGNGEGVDDGASAPLAGAGNGEGPVRGGSAPRAGAGNGGSPDRGGSAPRAGAGNGDVAGSDYAGRETDGEVAQ
ncbi:MAG: radical SAM protein [Deltaproteobacteria bacterium]|nr:radical SAM protein [Deltaproteobacteria bacterium]